LTDTQAQLTSTKSDLTSIQNKLDSAQKQIDLYKSTFGASVYAEIQPPYVEALNKPIILKPNNNAADPTWSQLQSFIQSDNTDKHAYNYSSYTCGDFAQTLYNNAELAGIRCAFVTIHFSDGIVPHALNVFKTTDKGLIYIDCQGYDQFDFSLMPFGTTTIGVHNIYDKVAYIKVGQPLGLITIPQVNNYGLDYNAYQKWTTDKQTFESALSSYNKEVTDYNNSGGVVFGSPEDRYLQSESNALNALANELGGIFEPMGVVRTIEIYW
jgi:hypothetical protein